MTTPPPPAPGRIGWVDLTVDDAPGLRDFYTAVTGWTAEGLSMGDYDDYVMKAPDGTPQAGVCHARGSNQGLPAQWLVYITVPDLDDRLQQVEALGGTILRAPKPAGPMGRFAVIEDPAGAVCALFEPANDS
jgi:predicted enzyme related to lactoylglutathione lyase